MGGPGRRQEGRGREKPSFFPLYLPLPLVAVISSLFTPALVADLLTDSSGRRSVQCSSSLGCTSLMGSGLHTVHMSEGASFTVK